MSSSEEEQAEEDARDGDKSKPGDLLAQLRVQLDQTEKRILQLEKSLKGATHVNELLRRETSILREREKQTSGFISIMAHDCSTPLQVILGNLEMIRFWDKERLVQDLPGKLDVLIRSVKRIDSLRKDCLELSKLTMDPGALGKRSAMLGRLIRDWVEEFRPLAEQKGLELKLELEELGMVWCSPRWLRQVVENYLSNAARYTQKGGHIIVGGRREEHGVTVWVKDDGRGIDQKELENIFKPFYRTGERVEGSTGLGLSIVGTVVEAHGGEAWAESEGEGKGSCFFFEIPLDNNGGQSQA